MRYTPWIVSEHVPDYSTLANLLASPRLGGRTGADLAVALWELMVDRELGIFHYFPANEPFAAQSSCDPLKILNVYGFAICGVHAHVLAGLCKAGGLPARVAELTGHEAAEFFHDGRWHYIDSDLQTYHRLRAPGEHVIASRQDLFEDPSLVDEQPNPSNPYHLPDRLPGGVRRLYESEPTYVDAREERTHSMDFRLRPGEEMTRYFHHRGRWIVFDHYAECFRRWPTEPGPEGPTERFWPRRQWGNGFLHYAPRLSDAFADVEQGADLVQGLDLTAEGLICPGGEGRVVFAFESPYIYCGVPDPLGRVGPAQGATVSAAFVLPEGAAARIEAAAELSDDWQTVWDSAGATGEVAAEADFTAFAERRYRLRLRFVLSGPGARLTRFTTRLWFMVSPHSLPALRTAGPNRMRVHFGDRHGLPTRPVCIEKQTCDADFLAGLHATENLRWAPDDFVRLYCVDESRPWRVVYELAAPDGGRMAWVAAMSVIEGRKPSEPCDHAPTAIEIADSPAGPWRTVAEREIAPDAHGWHFIVFGEGRFAGDRDRGYVRFSARGKGAHRFVLAGHYVPAGEPAASPLEIEHVWYEDDPLLARRERRHVQIVQGDTTDYVVSCAAVPHNERISLRVASVGK